MVFSYTLFCLANYYPYFSFKFFCITFFSMVVLPLIAKSFVDYYLSLEAYWSLWETYLLQSQKDELEAFSKLVLEANHKVALTPTVTRSYFNPVPVISAILFTCAACGLYQFSFGRWLIIGAFSTTWNGNSVLLNVCGAFTQDILENTFTEVVYLSSMTAKVTNSDPMGTAPIIFNFSSLEAISEKFVEIHGLPPVWQFIDLLY